MKIKNKTFAAFALMVLFSFHSHEAKAFHYVLSEDRVIILNDCLSTSIPIQASIDGKNWADAVYTKAGGTLEYETYTSTQPNPTNTLYIRYTQNRKNNLSPIYRVHGGELLRLHPKVGSGLFDFFTKEDDFTIELFDSLH